MVDWLRAYHCLPHHMRTVIASARGYYLRHWRYGPESKNEMSLLHEREEWNLGQWKSWQHERLRFILERAATRVPFYSRYWQVKRGHRQSKAWLELENWPILTKETLKRCPEDFVADDCNTRRMFRDSTSGTTGTPLSVYMSRGTLRKAYALYEARVRRWHGVSVEDRWAIMGGQMIVPFSRERPPFWVYNRGLNQLYLSTHHLKDANVEAYVDAIRSFGPTHMVAYPSSASFLAAAILERRMEPLSIKIVVCNAEVLSERQRARIASAFGCRVVNVYGMAEFSAGASECEAGTMHIWPEAGMIEVLQDDEDATCKAGQVGRLVVTGLLNEDMPLIRYDVGDRGSVNMTNCECQRRMPVLTALEGRNNDLLITRDGRKVFWLNPVFYGLPVREAQIIQDNLLSVRIKIVGGDGYGKAEEEIIAARLKARVGDMDIRFENVDLIGRSANGKLRSVISHVSPG